MLGIICHKISKSNKSFSFVSDLDKEMLKVILNKNLKEYNQRKAEYAEEVTWLAILFL